MKDKGYDIHRNMVTTFNEFELRKLHKERREAVFESGLIIISISVIALAIMGVITLMYALIILIVLLAINYRISLSRMKNEFEKENNSKWYDMLIWQTEYVNTTFEVYQTKMSRYFFIARNPE